MTDHTQGTDDDGGTDADGDPPPGDRMVVAVLAAAHDPESLRDFLKQLPPGGGIAYMLLIDRPAGIAGPEPAMLARQTALPLKEIAAPAAVEPDHVYVAGPGKALRLEGGSLLPRPAQRAAGPGLTPTDGFLLSLAEETGVLGVSAVLSVAGGDGLFG